MSEDATVSVERSVPELDLEKLCADARIQVVIDNLPPELDLDQQTAAKKFIRNRASLVSNSDYDIERKNLVQHVIDTGMHRPFKQPLRTGLPRDY